MLSVINIIRFIRSEPSSSDPASISWEAWNHRGNFTRGDPVVKTRWVDEMDGDKNKRGYIHAHDILNLLAPVPNAEFTFFDFLGHLFVPVGILGSDILQVLP